jgi:hypothetical protein
MPWVGSCASQKMQQVGIGDDLRVEHDQHDLGMAGQAGAGLLVGRIGREAAGIADRRNPDAFGLPEQALRAPEAAQAEQRRLQPFRIGALQRTLRDMVLRRRRDGPLAAGQRLAGFGKWSFLFSMSLRKNIVRYMWARKVYSSTMKRPILRCGRRPIA